MIGATNTANGAAPLRAPAPGPRQTIETKTGPGMGKLKNTAVWIVFGLLAVGLMGFGTGQFSTSLTEIGSAGSKPITVQAYGSQLQAQLRAIEAQTGQPVTFAQAQEAGLDRAVLGRLVQSRVLDAETQRLGLSVGDAAVAEQVRQVQAFQGLDGKFDPEAYRFALDRQGLDVDEFEETIRDDLTRNLFQTAVLSGIASPDIFADVVLTYIQQTRTVTWAPITGADLDADLPGATDADLTQYYDDTIARYTRPEARDVRYAALLPADIMDELPVDETALRALYDERAAQYIQPERRIVERLVYPDADTAQAAATRLIQGDADFETLVADRGLDLADVDMGDVTKASLDAAGAEVFAADQGAIVGPVDSDLGPALFRVNVILPAQETSFDDARAELRETLAAEAARRAIDDRREQIADLIAGGADVAALAERTDMTAGTFTWDGDSIADVAGYESIRLAVPALTQGALPQLVETDDGGLVALVLEAVSPAAPIPFDDARAQVLIDWRAATLDQMVAERAEQIASALREGRSFESMDLQLQTAQDLGRRGRVPGTPEGFVPLVFDTDVGQIATLGGQSVAVVLRVDHLGQQALPVDQQQQMRSTLAGRATQGIAEDILTAVAGQIRARTDVTINQQALSAVNGQFQ